MKKSQKVFLVLGLVFVFALAFYADVAPPNVQQSKIAVIKPPVSSSVIFKPCEGPDLKAIRPTITKSTVGANGFLNITAQITNVGTKVFTSSPAQAKAQLIVKKLWMSGASAYVYVRDIPIASLAVNASVNLSGRFQLPQFSRWEGPVTPGTCLQEVQVIVRVAYDPDILMDGNVANDDCNYNNNQCADVPANHVKYLVECPW